MGDGAVMIIMVGLVVYFAYTVGFLAGFGPSLLAMPLLLMVEDVYFIRPLLTSFGAVMFVSLSLSQRRWVQLPVLRQALCVAGVGLPLGMLAYSYLPKTLLLFLIACLALLASLRGLAEEFFRIGRLRLPPLVLRTALFLAGVIHGAFTTGGPLLVVYMAQRLPEKVYFRATQSAVFACFNVVLTVQLFLFPPPGASVLKPMVLWRYALALPFLAAAMLTGHAIQKRLPPELFRKIVYLLLLASAINILVNLVQG